MQMHHLVGAKRRKKRVGRGGKRGTYSGRGGKGQTARAGHRIRPAIRDYLKQIPKRRGRHKHSFVSPRAKAVVVNVGDINITFRDGETVNPKTLAGKGLIALLGKRMPCAKILGEGMLAKRLTVTGCAVSASAKEKIIKAGGSVIRASKCKNTTGVR